MKQAIALIMILLSLAICFCALCEEAVPASASDTALLEAYSTTKFLIRETPEEKGRRIKTVEPGEKVAVYGCGTAWCIIAYQGVTGYCKTEWLYRARSLQPFKAQVPGRQQTTGIARVTSAVIAKVKGYGGNTLAPGDLLAVTRWENGMASVPMMRGTAEIPAGHLAFEPFVPWDKAEPGDVIGGFTTYYNETTGGRKLAKNRQYNIGLACGRVNGQVVSAGADFSYNGLCAPYTKGNGYQMAPNISRDGVGYGGGVCQLTTTIYNAALGLPLQIKEWALHRDLGVAYIPRGFDAAVGSYSDFIFTNTLPYDIQLQALPQNGVLTVLIARTGAKQAEHIANPEKMK